MKKNILTLLLLTVITLVGLGLRIYKLNDYPVQLGHDEVTQLYDAISVAQTGKDIYGVKYPFIFKSVNDNKPPFYTYATIVAYKIFGWQDITIRIPGVFFGTLLIPIVYLFTLSLFKKKSYAFAGAILTAIAPFEIFYARKAFENQAGICFILLAFSIFLTNYQNKVKPWNYYFFPVILALGAYTYFSHAILIPLLFIATLIIFRLNLREIAKLLVIFLLAIVPLWVLIIKHPESMQRTKDVSILQDRMLSEKLNQIKPNGAIGLVKKYYTIGNYSFYRYASHFSPNFLFVNGLTLSNWNTVNVGPFYWWQILFLLSGLVLLISSQVDKKIKLFYLAFVLICLIPAGTTFEDKSPHRVIIFFTLLDILAAYGLVEVLKLISNKNIKYLSFVILGAVVLVCSIYSGLIYTRIYPVEKSEYIHYPYKNVTEFAWQHYDKYSEIIFDSKFGSIAPFIGTGSQYYFAYYGHYSPQKMQNNYNIGDSTVRETYFDKFHIKAVYWPNDSKKRNTLIIASPWSLPNDIGSKAKIIKTFNYYRSDKIAFLAIELN